MSAKTELYKLNSISDNDEMQKRFLRIVKSIAASEKLQKDYKNEFQLTVRGFPVTLKTPIVEDIDEQDLFFSSYPGMVQMRYVNKFIDYEYIFQVQHLAFLALEEDIIKNFWKD